MKFEPSKIAESRKPQGGFARVSKTPGKHSGYHAGVVWLIAMLLRMRECVDQEEPKTAARQRL